MTREQLIETMARAIGRQDGIPDDLWSASVPHATAALTAIEAAGMRVVPMREPVAWRVKDFADGWILFSNENGASRYASETGALMQALAAQEDSTSE
jgi:hypothetical protein